MTVCGADGSAGIAARRVTLKFTDLSVDVMTQTVPVSTAAGFTVGISPSGPSLALLLDANGDGVLMAMFDPSVASHAISTHTTAVALLYYGMNAYMFPASAMSQILALIDGDPAIAALAAAIATAVAVDLSAREPLLGRRHPGAADNGAHRQLAQGERGEYVAEDQPYQHACGQTDGCPDLDDGGPVGRAERRDGEPG